MCRKIKILILAFLARLFSWNFISNFFGYLWFLIHRYLRTWIYRKLFNIRLSHFPMHLLSFLSPPPPRCWQNPWKGLFIEREKKKIRDQFGQTSLCSLISSSATAGGLWFDPKIPRCVWKVASRFWVYACKLKSFVISPGVGTRYISGWGGAARPLIPWSCLRQISLIFLPCLRQNSDFLIPCFRHLTRILINKRL